MTHRRSFVPLFWYSSVALGIPFLNGAHHNPAFYAHAASVLATLASATALALIVQRVRNAWRRNV